MQNKTITEIEEETLVGTLVEELVESNKAIVVYNDDLAAQLKI